MVNRGEYRTIFCSFGDDPDVHELSGDAVKLLLLLKLGLPPTGIGAVYPSMCAEKMRCTIDQVEAIFDELGRPKRESDRGWIARQRNVVWIFNALKHEPNLFVANAKKHVPFVRRLVAELDPKLEIVAAFKSYYKEWFPDALDTVWIGYRNRIDTVSHTVSIVSSVEDKKNGIDRVSIGYRNNSSSSSRTNQEQELKSGDPGKERAMLPPAAREFGRTFYGSAPLSRKRDVKRQLLAALNGAGAQLRKGVRVRAGSPERLEAKCREVIADPPRDHDRAIVVLLTKLADVGNAQDSPTEHAAAETKREERRDETDVAQRLADAEAWLAENPDIAQRIESEIDAELMRQQLPSRGPLGDVTRRVMRRSAVVKAYGEAHEPVGYSTEKSSNAR